MTFDHTIVWAGIVALALSLDAGTSAQTPPGPADDATAALIDRLHGTLVDADYDAVDLEDVIDGLRAEHGINIHISWKQLAAAGVRKDDRIELTLRQVSLATLLDMILREASPDVIDPLAYSVRDGLLIISTREFLAQDTVLRTYDITDLIESGYSIRRFANTPVLGLQLTGREFIGGERRETTAQGGGGGGGAGGGIYGDPEDEAERPSAMERVQQVIDLIVESVGPDDWQMNGGETASIRAHDSNLLIRHTIDGHRQLESFLELLRSHRPAPLDAEAIVVRLRSDRAAQVRGEIGEDFPRLGAEQVHRLTAGEGAGDVLFRAATTGHNGERLWFSALTQRDVLAGVQPTVSANAAAFAPITGTATEGLELIVLPLLDVDGARLNLDIQLAWVPASQIDARPVTLSGGAGVEGGDDGGRAGAGSIDRVTRSMRTVSTSATLRRDQAIVLTIPRQLDDRGQAAEFEDWLIVRVRTAE